MSDHTCAVTSEGAAKCWGYNQSGQLGDGTSGNRRGTPVTVTGLETGVAAIATGGAHTCALLSTGGVTCWGLNSRGQLGDGTSTQRDAPVNVQGLSSGAVALAAGEEHTCALMDSGEIKCWGRNQRGQLGNGETTNRTSPETVLQLKIMAGDVNCSGTVDTIDALLVLQLVASLLQDLQCQDMADVNLDGLASAVDASLILQFVASLIDSLPPT